LSFTQVHIFKNTTCTIYNKAVKKYGKTMSQKWFGQICIMETENKIFPVLPRYKKRDETEKTLMYNKTHLSANTVYIKCFYIDQFLESDSWKRFLEKWNDKLKMMCILAGILLSKSGAWHNLYYKHFWKAPHVSCMCTLVCH